MNYLALTGLLAQALTLFDPAFLGRTVSATSSECATSDTTLPHDKLLEGFQTPGYENTWTETGTTANINDAYDSSALTTGKPAGACDRALNITFPTDGVETWSQYNYGSAIDVDAAALDMVFYLYIITAPDNGEEITIFIAAGPTAGDTAAYITLRNNGGTIELSGAGTSASAYQSISTGQWLQVKLHMAVATTGSESYLQVDGGTQRTFDRIAAKDPRYLKVGSPGGLSPNESGELVFDLITMDTP